MDSEGLIIANDCGNRRLLLLAFDGDKDQLVHLRDLVSSDLVELPQSFHPRRFCVGSRGKVYVGSGYNPSPGTTSGSVTVWNIRVDAAV